MSSLIKLEDAPELKGVDESKALQIKSTFEPMVKLVEAVEDERQKVITAAKEGVTKQVMADARKLRLGVSRIRINAENKRKEMKQEYLRAGQAVDGASNVLKWAIVGIEKEMKEIEDHFLIMEKERLFDLQTERVELISPYLEDAGERDLASMEDDVWDSYLSTKKQAHDDRVAAEKKAEEDRLAKEEADRVEQARIKADNERLQKEADDKAAQDKIDAEKRELERQKDIAAREKLEKDRVAKEEVERKERESKEREAQEERDRIQREKDAAHEATIKAEREKQQKLADDLKAKEEAEAKKEADAETARQAELNKGDTEKVADLIVDLEAIKSKYSFDSKSNKRMFASICDTLDIALERILQ